MNNLFVFINLFALLISFDLFNAKYLILLKNIFFAKHFFCLGNESDLYFLISEK